MNLEEAVATLPQSHDPHDTYVFLADNGVRGEESSSCNCPVANYLTDAVGWPVNVYSNVEGELYASMSFFDKVFLPVGVQKFIRKFDVRPRELRRVWLRWTA